MEVAPNVDQLLPQGFEPVGDLDLQITYGLGRAGGWKQKHRKCAGEDGKVVHLVRRRNAS
jgi:hypothetical protein